MLDVSFVSDGEVRGARDVIEEVGRAAGRAAGLEHPAVHRPRIMRVATDRDRSRRSIS